MKLRFAPLVPRSPEGSGTNSEQLFALDPPTLITSGQYGLSRSGSFRPNHLETIAEPLKQIGGRAILVPKRAPVVKRDRTQGGTGPRPLKRFGNLLPVHGVNTAQGQGCRYNSRVGLGAMIVRFHSKPFQITIPEGRGGLIPSPPPEGAAKDLLTLFPAGKKGTRRGR